MTQSLRKTLELLESLNPKDFCLSYQLEYYYNLGSVYHQLGIYQDAYDSYMKVLEIMKISKFRNEKLNKTIWKTYNNLVMLKQRLILSDTEYEKYIVQAIVYCFRLPKLSDILSGETKCRNDKDLVGLIHVLFEFYSDNRDIDKIKAWMNVLGKVILDITNDARYIAEMFLSLKNKFQIL